MRFSLAIESIPTSESLEAHAYDYDMSMDGRFSDSDSDDEGEPGELKSRDSLTMLNRGQSTHQSGEDAVPPAMLQKLLQQILQALSSGQLTPQQMKNLSLCANDILSCMPMEPQGMIVEQTSSTSLLADEVVRQTVECIEKELLDKHIDQSQQTTPIPLTRDIPRATLSCLVEFIVDRVVTSAYDSIMVFDEMDSIPHVVSSKTRPGSAPPTPVATPTMTKKLEGPIYDSSSSSTSTTDFVQKVLHRVAKEVASEISKLKETETNTSSTDVLVRDVLQNTLLDLRMKESGYTDWNGGKPLSAPTSSSSVTSIIVKDTIAKVLQELEDSGELPQEAVDVNQSVSSIFAEGLIVETLQTCLRELRTGTLEPNVVKNLAESILKSTDSTQKISPKKRIMPQCTQSEDQLKLQGESTTSASSILVEALIKETLQKVKSDIESGTIAPEDLLTLAESLGFSGVQPLSQVQQPVKQKSKPLVNFKSATSFTAEESVKAAVKNAIRTLCKEKGPQSFTDIMAEQTVRRAIRSALSKHGKKALEAESRGQSSTSILAEECIQQSIQTALEESMKMQQSMTQLPISVTHTGSSSSSLAEQCVQSALDSAMAASDLELEYLMCRSSTSDLADLCVRSALCSAMEEEPPDSATASMFVTSAIEQVLSQMSSVLLPVASSNSSSGSGVSAVVDDVLSNVLTSLKQAGVYSPNIIGNAPIPKKVFSDVKLPPDEESSGSENGIVPMMEDHRLPVDHHIVEDSLSIISVKHERDQGHPYEASQRVSFGDLTHPNVAHVRRLSGSDELARSRIMAFSSREIYKRNHPSVQEMEEPGLTTPPDPELENMKDDELISTIVNVQDIAKNDEGNSRHGESHIVADVDEDSSDSENDIVPMMGDHPLDIDHHVIENALSIISVKHDHDLNHPSRASARNSFGDLSHPDISSLGRFGKQSSDLVAKSKILSYSVLNSHIEVDTSSSDISTVTPPDPDISTLDDNEPVDSIVNVENIHHSTKTVSHQSNSKVNGNRSKENVKSPKHSMSGKSSKSSASKQATLSHTFSNKSHHKKSDIAVESKSDAHAKVPSTKNVSKSSPYATNTKLASPSKSKPRVGSRRSLDIVMKTSDDKVNVKKSDQSIKNDSSKTTVRKSSQSTVTMDEEAHTGEIDIQGRQTPAAEAVDEEIIEGKISVIKKKSSTLKQSKTSLRKKSSAEIIGHKKSSSSAVQELGISLSQSSKKDFVSSKDSASRVTKQSHHTVNLTPRPSSAYRKSPSLQSMSSQQSVARTSSKKSIEGSSPARSTESLRSIDSSSKVDSSQPSRDPSRESVFLTPKASDSDLMAGSKVNNKLPNVLCTMSDTQSINDMGDAAHSSCSSLPQATRRESLCVPSIHQSV